MYNVYFTQTLDEVRTVRASSEDDAEDKLKKLWEGERTRGVLPQIKVFKVEECVNEQYDPEGMGNYIYLGNDGIFDKK